MRRWGWVMFAVYCLLASAGWLVALPSEKVRGVVYGVVGLGAVVLNGRKRLGAVGDLLRVGLWAGLLVGVPEVVAGQAGRHVAGVLWTALLAVVPVMVVLVVAQGSEEEAAGAWRLLAPAVAGLGGFLLVVPVDFPRSAVGWVSFGVLVVSAVLIAWSSVVIHRVLRGVSVVQAVSAFCLANAVVLLVAGFVEGDGGWGLDVVGWISVAVQAGTAVLLVVLLRWMEPVRFAARFLVIPLLVILEGFVLLRPELSLRMVSGVVLMAGAVGVLLGSRRVDEVSSLSLR